MIMIKVLRLIIRGVLQSIFLEQVPLKYSLFFSLFCFFMCPPMPYHSNGYATKIPNYATCSTSGNSTLPPFNRSPEPDFNAMSKNDVTYDAMMFVMW
jgi:hypothetical protein